MAEPYVRQARGVFTALVGSTALVAGDLVYWDGTNYERADADVNTTFAEAVATNSYESGDTGTFCTSCIVVDIDAPYTQGSVYYLAAPAGTPVAGNFTATRPTGVNDLVQSIGFGLSTSELRVEIAPVRERTISVAMKAGTVETTAQSNDHGGISLSAAGVNVFGSFMVPQNCVGFKIAYFWYTTAVTLDATDTYTFDVSAGYSTQATTTHADGIAAAAATLTADLLASVDVSAAFDGAGLIDPGNVVSVNINKVAEGSAGDDAIVLSVDVVLLEV